MEKVINQLKEKDGKVGIPLFGTFFREKHLNGKRPYFIVYNKLSVVLLVGISDKKGQQNKINSIIAKLEFYKKSIENMIKILISFKFFLNGLAYFFVSI